MASSASAALALLHQQLLAGTPFELMLTDWCMPEMDGGMLLDAIAAVPEFNPLAIIVLSSAGMSARPEVTERAPILLKPVRQSELHNLIAQCIAGDLVQHLVSLEQPRVESSFSKLSGRILLAEDNPVNQEVATAMLQGMGLSLMIVNNGQEALTQLAQEHFDLVLMDCQMPVMDGFEATANIRQREVENSWPAMPIIALTANAISGDREFCLVQGMSDYLSKPFAQGQLHEVLVRWLPKRSASATITTLNSSLSATTSKVKSPVRENSVEVEIDQQIIRQLRELREGLLTRIIELFRSSSPALIAQLQEAVTEQNGDKLYKTAHNFKNSAANLGLIALAAACRECESKARQGDLYEAPQQLASIRALYELSLQALVELELREQSV